MHFDWNGQTEKWLLDASSYTGYNENLAALLKKYIRPGDSLCDIGCGLGLVDFALADYAGSICCVDQARYAVEYIRTRARERGIGTISARCEDGGALEGRWDTVMALFHGTAEDVMRCYLRLAQHRFILVTHGSAHGSTGPEGYRVRKCCDADSVTAWLDAQGFRYVLERTELEFGQPHTSFEDALAFHRTYSLNAPEDALAAHVKATVQETGRADFPLYTPKKRKFAVFVMDRQENEQLL